MRFLLLSLVAVALVGCSDHPVDQSVAINEATVDDICTCPAYAAEDFCTMPERLSDAEVACYKRVYNEYEAELKDTIDCFIEADQELRSCVASADCDDTRLNSCFEVQEARYDACPVTTEAAAAAFDACEPG